MLDTKIPTGQSGLDELLDTAKAADYLHLSAATLMSWRSRHLGPRFVRLGRAVRYRRVDLDAFVVSGLQTGGVE